MTSPTIKTPFRPGAGIPPVVMVSRDAVAATATAVIGTTIDRTPVAPLLVTGLRGMGKTVLLRRIAAETDAKRCLVMFVEGESGKNFDDTMHSMVANARERIARPAQRVGKAVKAAFKAMPSISYDLPHEAGSIRLDATKAEDRAAQTNLGLLIADLNRECKSRGMAFALLIDEVQEVDIDTLRSVLVAVHNSMSTDSPIALIVAGLPESVAHLAKARSYSERITKVTIGLVPPEAAAMAFEEPVRQAGASISKDAVELLVQKSYGYPYFIQLYGAAAWAQRKGARIAKADVERAVPAADLQADELYVGRADKLTTRELGFVVALAQLGSGFHFVRDVAKSLKSSTAKLGSVVQQLTLKGIVFSPGFGRIEFSLPGFDAFVRRNVESFRAPGIS